LSELWLLKQGHVLSTELLLVREEATFVCGLCLFFFYARFYILKGFRKWKIS